MKCSQTARVPVPLGPSPQQMPGLLDACSQAHETQQDVDRWDTDQSPHGQARDQLGFPRTAACCDANGDCGGQGTRRDPGLLAQPGHACTRSHPMTAPPNQRRSQQGVPPLQLRRGHAGTARQGHAHRPTCGRPEARRPQAQRNYSLPIRAASSGDTFCLTTTVFLALTAEPVSRAPCGRRDWS